MVLNVHRLSLAFLSIVAHGWVILIAGAVEVLASIPGQTMGVSVFTNHLVPHYEYISRVGLSSAYMVGTLGSSLIISYAGVYLADMEPDRLLFREKPSFLGLFQPGPYIFSSNITSTYSLLSRFIKSLPFCGNRIWILRYQVFGQEY